MNRADWNAMRAWWHRRVLGHNQIARMNDEVGPPRIICYCWGQNHIAPSRARVFHV